MARYVGLPTLTNIFEPVERGNQQCPIFFFFRPWRQQKTVLAFFALHH